MNKKLKELFVKIRFFIILGMFGLIIGITMGQFFIKYTWDFRLGLSLLLVSGFLAGYLFEKLTIKLFSYLQKGEGNEPR